MQNLKCPLPIGMENTKFLNYSILSQEVDRVIGKRFGSEQCLPTVIPLSTILKKLRIHIKVFFKSFIKNWKFLNKLNHWGQILFNKISSHCTTLLICLWQKGKEENTQIKAGCGRSGLLDGETQVPGSSMSLFIELNRELGSCMKLNKDGLSHTCKQEAGFMM